MSLSNSPIPQEYAANVFAIDTADGSAIQPNRDANPPGGCTLIAGHTYVFMFGGARSQMSAQTLLQGAQLKWDAAIVLTSAIIEETNFPAKPGGEVGGGRDDVKDWDVGKGNWIQQNPSTAYVSVTSSDGTLGGATVTNATLAVAGGTAGGSIFDVGNSAALRMRLKVVVGGTGGVLRVGLNGKMP